MLGQMHGISAIRAVEGRHYGGGAATISVTTSWMLLNGMQKPPAQFSGQGAGPVSRQRRRTRPIAAACAHVHAGITSQQMKLLSTSATPIDVVGPPIPFLHALTIRRVAT